MLAKLAKESLFYQKGPAYEAVDTFIMRNTTEFRAAVQQAVLEATPAGAPLPWAWARGRGEGRRRRRR